MSCRSSQFPDHLGRYPIDISSTCIKEVVSVRTYIGPEMVLRDDGVTTDLGYPWAVVLDKKRVLVTYYFATENKSQHIAGTIIELR